MVVVALAQIESIEVVGHLAVVEGAQRTLHSRATLGGARIVIARGIVAVHDLRAIGASGRADDGVLSVLHRRGSLLSALGVHHPAVLGIAVALECHAGRGEGAGDAQVIDVAAECAEE